MPTRKKNSTKKNSTARKSRRTARRPHQTTTRAESPEEMQAPNLSPLRREMGKSFARKIVIRAEYDEDIIQELIVFCDTLMQDMDDRLLIYDLASSTLDQACAMSSHARESSDEYVRQLRAREGTK